MSIRLNPLYHELLSKISFLWYYTNTMIPQFPEFKKLELTDKKDIESFTKRFPPYSDFNFASMWGWDTKGDMLVSQLNNNLVVCFTDYLTGEPFYSFLGDNEINDTAEKLISFSKEQSFPAHLKLIPEVSANGLDRERFIVTEDRNNFDYMLAVESLKPHDGTLRPLSSRRKLINKLKLLSHTAVVPIDIHDSEIAEKILSVFSEWESRQGMNASDILILKNALHKVLQSSEIENTLAFGLLINEKFEGYSINEFLGNEYAIGSFQQASTVTSQASYALLMQEVAVYLDQLGCKYLNLEQDLGIEGLRKWKLSYKPTYYLKKYVVTAV